jgi:hypothetical protein
MQVTDDPRTLLRYNRLTSHLGGPVYFAETVEEITKYYWPSGVSFESTLEYIREIAEEPHITVDMILQGMTGLEPLEVSYVYALVTAACAEITNMKVNVLRDDKITNLKNWVSGYGPEWIEFTNQFLELQLKSKVNNDISEETS